MSSPDRILLDTHVVLWWQAGSGRLSRSARAAVDGASSIGISPISIFEVGLLVAKERIALDRPLRNWVTDLFADPRIDVIEMDATVAAIASTLESFHGDPADRMIYASALVSARPLVTKDARIRRYAKGPGEVTAIW